MGTFVEHVAQDFLPEVDPGQADLDMRDHCDRSLGRAGDGGKTVDCADIEREF